MKLYAVGDEKKSGLVMTLRKKVLILIILSFVLTGVVSASSLWGNYKGQAIVKTKIAGTDFKPKGVPAILFDKQPLVPISFLDKAGVKYKYDKVKQTIDITKVETAVKPSDMKTAIKIALNFTDSITLIGTGYGLEATINYDKTADENADWEAIFTKLTQLSKLDVDHLRVFYYEGDHFLGTVGIARQSMIDYNNGKLTDISSEFDVQGNIFGSVLPNADFR